MSIKDYLSKEESLLLAITLNKSDKSVKKHTFGFTNMRVFWFRKSKGYNVEYQDMPLEKLCSIELYWKSRNILKLLVGIILLIIGIATVISFIGIPFLLIGLYLIVKGLKQYGDFRVIGTNSVWGFDFQKKANISKFRKLIQSIYYVKRVPISGSLSDTGIEELLASAQTSVTGSTPDYTVFPQIPDPSSDSIQFEGASIITPQPVPINSIECSNCGKENPLGTLFCSECGRSIM